jgi:hypothetical protein
MMLSRRELSVDRLAAALREADRPDVRERARTLERRLKEAVAGR